MDILNNAVENSVNTETFLDHLRNQTAHSHKKLENLPVSVSITSDQVTKGEYAHYLNVMEDVVASAEISVFPILEQLIPDLKERKKQQLLENDLTFIGYKKNNYSPVFTGNYSLPFALGILYVVEGSSLGGRFILKNIESTLGFDENNGATYFAGYGNKTGSYWKNFLNILTSYEATNQNGAEIIAGADYAFDTIYKHFAATRSV